MVVIHQRIDGFTPDRPEHQDAWVEGGRLALERHGKSGLGIE
jgi:hypothetical protein